MTRRQDTGEIVGIQPDENGSEVQVNFSEVFVQPVSLARELLQQAGIEVKIGQKFTAEVEVDADQEYDVKPTDFSNNTQLINHRTYGKGLTARNWLGR